MSKILVVGSSNVDMVAKVGHLPCPGETVGDAVYMQANGGKGANQAIAAKRLGGDVAFVTCLGDDSNSEMLQKQFAAEGLDIENIQISKGTHTGTALIFVSDEGENCIAVAPGANKCIQLGDIDKIKDLIADSEYVLVQQEIPIATVEYLIDCAWHMGKKVILNPAPASKMSESSLGKLYLITPNESESEFITGVKVVDAASVEKAAGALLDKGVQNVILTLGSNGSFLKNRTTSKQFGVRKVKAVDTTAAGDVFNGALTVALSEGKSFEDAIHFATVSSSISITRMGAQSSIPYREEVDKLL